MAEHGMTGGQGDGPEGSGNAPWRWLLVIVLLVILFTTSASLLSLWANRLQDAARQTFQRQAEPPPPAPPATPTDPGNSRPPPAPARELWRPEPPPTPAPEVEQEDAAGGFDATAIVDRIVNADAERGAQHFRICAACHTSAKGADHRVGPNLWNIVGRRKAAEPRFRFSQALRDRGGAWTYADLAAYLHDPRAFVPGTSMAFRGIADEQRLANLIAYLRTLSDDPPPLP